VTVDGPRWVREAEPRWNDDKYRIIAGAPSGAFDVRLTGAAEGALLPGAWWRVEDDGRVVGYGWLDVSWGDAEILLAVDPSAQRSGVGSFILDHLEAEARKMGLRYLTNIVRPSHPQADQVTGWLSRRGFRASEDGRLLRAAARS
jgi:ribosomal protein S18 acetylase RimI-like enzyme